MVNSEEQKKEDEDKLKAYEEAFQRGAISSEALNEARKNLIKKK